MKTTLTKSLYQQGMQCKKMMWLNRHKPSAIAQPTEFDKIVIETGIQTGELAQKLFPNGVEVSKNLISCEARVEATKELIDAGVETIFEATFSHDDVEVRVDIFNKTLEGYELLEVKSSTKEKKIQKYVTDLSIQNHIVSVSGYKVARSQLIMLDEGYQRQQSLEIKKLFKFIDVSNEVAQLQNNIPQTISEFTDVILSNQEPDIDIGCHCHAPDKCRAKTYCWEVQKRLPKYSPINIFTLGERSLQLYHDGIVQIKDIPSDYKTTELQQFYIDQWCNKSIHVDYEEINEFLTNLVYPLFHLDFESSNPAVPQHPNSRPYQQIPFQYSLHVEQENGKLEHFEYLHDSKTDPREELIQKLMVDLKGGSESSSIMVYSSFEEKILSALARDFPEYSDQLQLMIDRIVDLGKLFQKRHYYSYEMHKKWSIKTVMPLLVPEMKNDYLDLQSVGKVSSGEGAILAFRKLQVLTDEKALSSIRQDLLDYCELDTKAMVEVLKAIRAIAKKGEVFESVKEIC